LVEIARALSSNPRVLFLDEPNSSLSHDETDRLLRVCRSMADEGCAVVFVTHRLREIFSIADYATVLKDGEVAWTGKTSSITVPEVVSMMAGPGRKQPPGLARQRAQSKPTDVVVRVEELSRKGEFSNVTFQVAGGEILGISGLIGSGRTELISAIAGLTRPSTGHIQFGELRMRSWRNPGEAWKAGLSIVPEDRHHDGLFSGMSVEWNMMSVCRTLGIAPISTAAQMAERLGIKTPSLSTQVSSLSGGNQQKVILARALLTAPRLLILDEPTRGVDVAAKADIYALIREQAMEGCAVILVSSELDEVIEMSDRVVVLRQGRLVQEFGPFPTSAQLVAAAFGEAA
jgi:ABC-type sugar transport system ATPase subunit